MERLTWERSLDGFTDVGLRDGVTEGDAICRLAAYEDTGLEPEEVERMNRSVEEFTRWSLANIEELKSYRELGTVDHLRKLVQAKQDGRLVMLLNCGTMVPLRWMTLEKLSF